MKILLPILLILSALQAAFAAGDQWATLAWDADATSVTGYFVYYQEAQAAVIGRVATPATSYTLTGLDDVMNYSAWVTAYVYIPPADPTDKHAKGTILESDPSNLVTWTTGSGYNGTPRFFNPVSLADGSMRLTFYAQPGAAFEVIATGDLRLPQSAWVSIGQAAEVSTGLFRITDPGAVGQPARFYAIKPI